jgi:hypothetical protein
VVQTRRDMLEDGVSRVQITSILEPSFEVGAAKIKGMKVSKSVMRDIIMQLQVNQIEHKLLKAMSYIYTGELKYTRSSLATLRSDNSVLCSVRLESH